VSRPRIQHGGGSSQERRGQVSSEGWIPTNANLRRLNTYYSRKGWGVTKVKCRYEGPGHGGIPGTNYVLTVRTPKETSSLLMDLKDKDNDGNLK